MNALALLRLAVKCPKCGRPPALRITEREKKLHADESPNAIAGTAQCSRCGETYAITAEAFHNAA
jgi:ribosomal protein S27AE